MNYNDLSGREKALIELMRRTPKGASTAERILSHYKPHSDDLQDALEEENCERGSDYDRR